MEELRYIPGVTTLKLDSNACVGCRMCTRVCPHGVFKMQEKTAVFADKDGCMECGACALNCPSNAISVNPGVGCATAIINSWLKGKGVNCGESVCC